MRYNLSGYAGDKAYELSLPMNLNDTLSKSSTNKRENSAQTTEKFNLENKNKRERRKNRKSPKIGL